LAAAVTFHRYDMLNTGNRKDFSDDLKSDSKKNIFLARFEVSAEVLVIENEGLLLKRFLKLPFHVVLELVADQVICNIVFQYALSLFSVDLLGTHSCSNGFDKGVNVKHTLLVGVITKVVPAPLLKEQTRPQLCQ
jgi:hypothetical protein